MSIIAILLLLVLSFVKADTDCVPASGQCYGSDDSLKKKCCEGVCMKKDEFYGQCMPEGTAVPDGWIGITTEFEMTTEDGESTDGMLDSGAPKAVEDEDDMMDSETPDSAMAPIGEEDDGAAMPAEPKAAPKPAMPQGPAAMGPMSDVMHKYVAFKGKDYLPNGTTPKQVGVQDLTPESVAGHVVMSQEECEDLCDAAATCNAASFYLDGEKVGGMNCWLKTMADTCVLPADADSDPNATLLLKMDESCTATMPQSSADLAPRSVEAGVPQSPQVKAPPESGTVSVSAGMEVTPPPSSSVGLHTTVLAVAIAGAAMALL